MAHFIPEINHWVFLRPLDKQIAELLIHAPLSTIELADQLGRSRGGDLSNALKDLMESGFLSRDYTWSFATEKRLESS